MKLIINRLDYTDKRNSAGVIQTLKNAPNDKQALAI